jgi:hypothetical protein
MSQSRQWTAVIAIVMTVVFGLALVLKLRPQLDLIEVGSRAPDFPAVDLATGQPMTFELSGPGGAAQRVGVVRAAGGNALDGTPHRRFMAPNSRSWR